MAIRNTVLGLLLAAGQAATEWSEDAACFDGSASCARSESDVEAAEAAEASLMEMQLLQTKVGGAAQVSRLPMAAFAAVADAELPVAARAAAAAADAAEPAAAAAASPQSAAVASRHAALAAAPAAAAAGRPQAEAASEPAAQPASALQAEVPAAAAAAAAEPMQVNLAAAAAAAEPSAHEERDVDDAVSAFQLSATVVTSEEQQSAVGEPNELTYTKIHHSFISPQVLQGAIPAAAIFVGFILTQNDHCRTLGLLSVYFGVQTGLNLYMKLVLSNSVIDAERGLKGIPGAFLITALQQVVSFCLLVPVLLILWPTPWRYTPKPLTSAKAWAGVIGLSVTFALNIGLNNLCLSLLPMSINLMIRSCIPLAAWLMQQLVACCIPGLANNSKPIEVGLMVLGVVFAGLASIAKEEGSGGGDESESKGLTAGIIIGVLSLAACALYLIFAQMLGQDVKMNPIDMTLYMSIPAALFLLPLMSMQHPVGWKGFDSLNDWQVLHEVMHSSPDTMVLVALSGFFAVSYNILQYTMVSELSATHTAFAGNFNKAATITMSLLLGLETLPSKPWGSITLASIVGGVASFTAYSIVKASGGGKGGH